ncbi:MAG: PAS domain S-box protein [Chthoniobacter sp.]|nr:PAS domain S-box protein [Chthoniobacter sp.]
MPKTRVRESKSPPSLRERAEAGWHAHRTDVADMPVAEIQRLVHELEIHQVELEMQNDELRRTQGELVESRDRFNDLYDFAPVGYATLDHDGTVLEANLTLAGMLRVDRAKLVDRKFSRFVARSAQDLFYLHHRAVLDDDNKRACELLLHGPDGPKFTARLETIRVRDSVTGSHHCRCAIIDITERQRAEEALAQSHEERARRADEHAAALHESERMAHAVVDALTAHIAIVDEHGFILAVNARWREFARQNSAPLFAVCEGVNYLDVCDTAVRRDRTVGTSFAKGIRDVLAGKSRTFEAEYPCHSATQQRWFTMRVTPFPGKGPRRAVISHENITTRVLAEQTVYREKEFSDRLIDTVQNIVLLLSPEGRIIRFNRHLEELSGWSLEEAQGKTWFDLFLAPPDRERSRELLKRTIRSRKPRRNILPIITKDGRKLHIEWDDAPLKNAEGRLVGLLRSGRDITESKRAEAALRESEAHYRQLVHALPAAVYTCDGQGRITLYNAAAVALWGREPRIGRDRWCGSHRIFTPDGKRLPLARCPLAMAMSQGEPIRGAELIVERPDGSRSHVLAFPDPIHDSSGAIVGAVNMLVDTTALKTVQNALFTTERKLRTLSRVVEQSPASVLITSPSGEIEYINPTFTAVTGYSLEEVLGKNPRLLKSGQQLPEMYRELWATIKAGRDWRGEFCNRKKNGEQFWEFAVIAPIQDEHGRVTHFAAIKEDITERKRLEAEVLAIREDERLRVSADLHDGICQELVGIQFLSTALRRDLEEAGNPLAARARRIGKAILTATEHTRETARGMNPVVADGSGLMHALRRLAGTTARTRRIFCSLQCPVPVSIESPLTANELYRIAQEAVQNALQHGRAKRITVRLREDGGELCLTVTDNGRGVPADVSRVPGMGLRVMKYRARLIGGQLFVQPRRSGGTKVTCCVPKPPMSK